MQEKGTALPVERLPHAVGDGDEDSLVPAQGRRDAVDGAGRLPVQAPARVVAPVPSRHARECVRDVLAGRGK